MSEAKNVLLGFVKEMFSKCDGDEIFIPKDDILYFYTVAKNSDLNGHVDIVDSGAENFIPYVEMLDSFFLDNKYLIEFDVVFSGVGISAISACIYVNGVDKCYVLEL